MPDSVASPGAARVFYSLGTAALFLYGAFVARDILIPFIVAVFASFLIYTLAHSAMRLPLVGRFLPAPIRYLFAFGVIFSIAILFIDIVSDNVAALVEAWPQYEDRLGALFATAVMRLQSLGLISEDFVGGVEALKAEALNYVNPILGEIGQSVQAFASNGVAIFLYTVFLLLERARLFLKFEKVFKTERQQLAVRQTFSDIATMVRQYITVKTVINLITGVVSYAVMRLIGVDFAGFWALLIFTLNYIPIVGAISAITLPVLLSLVQPDGGGVRMAALTLTFLVAAEQTMSSAIEPRLIGRSLNLSPLVILLSLAVWGAVWGFAGALLAVPITVTVMIVLTQFEATRPVAILMSENGKIADIHHDPIIQTGSASSETKTA